MNMLQKAEELARKAHEGQFRRDGKTPYITHPEKVVRLCETDVEKAVAWLHDVVEDTSMTMDDITEAGFPKEVVRAVSRLTKFFSHQPYMQYLEGVKKDPIATKVKIADMIANLSDKPTNRQVEKYAKGLFYLAE